MKKFLSLLLAAMMLLSMTSFAAAEEPFVLNVMLPDFYTDYDFNQTDNPVLDAIEAATGVRLNVQLVANSAYPDQTSYTLADPANMPMVMVLQGARDPIVVTSAQAGAFWDITDMIKDYPNLAAGSQGIYDNISIDGRLYSIYRARQQVRGGIYYRSDIAAAQGITAEPQTIEELTALAYALLDYCKTTDADDYVLNMVKYVAGTIGIATVTHGAPFNWGVDAEGHIYPAHQDPAFREGLKWLRDLYAAGGIDPDFMTVESGEWDKIERNELAFMRFDCMDNTYRQQEWFEKNAGVTDIIWAMIPGVKDDDGIMKLWPQNAGYSGVVAITKAVKEADLPKVLSFLDWCNTKEGQTLLNCGIDGLTYWIYDDGFMYTVPETGEDMATQVHTIQGSLNQLGMNVTGNLNPPTAQTELRMEYANYYTAEYTNMIVNDPCHALTSDTNIMMGTTLSQMLEDAHVQYIAGLIDDAGLDAVYAEWAMMGGEMMTAEYDAAYQATK